MKPRTIGLAWALAVVALLGAALVPATTAFAADRADPSASSSETDGTQTSTTEEGVTSFRNSRTVPFWSSSFTDPTNQVTYPFTMVGSDPRLERSTTVGTEIIPLKFTFVAGNQDVSVLNIPASAFPPNGYVATAQAVSMNGADSVADTIASPIFTPADFSISGDSGVQYGDAVMRAQFGKVGTGYHVILGQPKVRRTVTIRVPAGHGVAVFNPVGVLVGRVDAAWFKERLADLIEEMKIDPRKLPIFLSQNVFLYQDGDFSHCCILGGHGAGSPTSTSPVSIKGHKAVRSFVFAAYITPRSFPKFGAPFAGLSDIHALSHEISEWMDDPFGSNPVRPYLSPLQGTCAAVFETGDPVLGVWFPLPGNPNLAAGGLWHPEDEVFLNWFARKGQGPGLAPLDGRFTFMGPFTTHIPAQFGPFAAFGQVAQAC